MKFIKNRYFLLLISVAVSVSIAFIIVPIAVGINAQTIDVVRVKSVIKPNTMIEKNMLTVVKVGKANLPESIIKDPDELVGMYSKVELLPGDNLQKEKFISSKALDDSYMYTLAKEDKVAVSITIKSFASGVSGKIKPGDIISIMYYDRSNDNRVLDNSNESSRVIAHPMLQSLEVCDISKENEGAEYPSTITVLVNREQAKLLIEAENIGNIHVLSAGRGDESREILLKEDS